MLRDFLLDMSPKNSVLKTFYRIIQEEGPISRAELLRRTETKSTTATRFIDELLERGFIEECGVGESSGGRPPILYRVCAGSGYVVGIDVSRIQTQVFLFNAAFRQVDSFSFIMTWEHTPERVLAYLIEIIQECMSKHGFTVEKLLGIGIGAVGPLDQKRGIILQTESFDAPGWGNIHVVEQLQRIYPVPVLLENGANTAALGEYIQMKMSYRNVLYCISGAGLRCGIITDGQVMHSKIGSSSGHGHMIIQAGGLRCHCGNQGCLSAYMSFSFILEQVKSQLDRGCDSSILEQSSMDSEQLSIHHVIRAAKAGDTLANEVLLESAYYYGIGLANLINVLHPELVILNGPILYEVPAYYEKAVQTALRYVYTTEKAKLQFSQGDLRRKAVATGAARLIFQTFF